ncbi:hypothetical protein J2X65_000605 [Ancylobacter sp. 3268]|uniref:hypothetical protein n=1 Tax=Ancylobacter sp. 3268 TaxID=2817752 RepID=UPI002864A508|nr:hypothetical protein [Ancylobacter sp. 3268]MDR6951257.1 hypothetical protein [Ancylobacter sp. 3268]
MTSFPNSPKLIKGGIVQVAPEGAAVQRVIALQYNPESVSRSLQVQGVGENGQRAEALRLKGPAVETIKIDAEIDATDQLEFPQANPAATGFGVFPQLAALEVMVYPSSSQLQANNARAASGTLEIAPMEAPLTLFVWSKNRIVPVRITEFSVTEEAFDANLNPIRAKVSLGMRVLSVDDLGFAHRGGSLFMSYLQAKEQMAARAAGSSLGLLGIGGLP